MPQCVTHPPQSPCAHALILLGAIIALTGCQPSPVASNPKAVTPVRPTVATVNYPLLYFAERIAGDRIELYFPIPRGESPLDWQPPTDVLRAYQNADLILLNGPSHPAWVRQVALPAARTVDTTSAFRDQYLEAHDKIVHSHGPQGAHEHVGILFHTWLDPVLAQLQVRAILRALTQLLPGHETQLEIRAAELERDLEHLHRDFERLFSDSWRTLIASHPVYDYFARRYALELGNLHWEPKAMPEESEWRKLEALLLEHPGAAMIWEDTPEPEIAARLDRLGLPHTVVHPGDQRPQAGDLLTLLHGNLERLTQLRVIKGG